VATRGWSPLPVASFGPFLAAPAVLLFAGDRDGVRALWASMRDWRIGLCGWALVLGIPVLLTSIAAGLNLLPGAKTPALQAGGLAAVPLVFGPALLVPGLGGAWEEPGRRGFAFPRLAGRLGWISAALILGVVGALWHLPLILSGSLVGPPG
jgi:CAAX protease family protein